MKISLLTSDAATQGMVICLVLRMVENIDAGCRWVMVPNIVMLAGKSNLWLALHM